MTITTSSAHSPSFQSLHLRHSTFWFSKLSVTSPTLQLILQPFRHFTYVTTHSPTLSLLTHVTAYSPTLLLCFYVTGSSPGVPPTPNSCLEAWGKTTKKPSQISWQRDLNSGSPEYDSCVLLLRHLARFLSVSNSTSRTTWVDIMMCTYDVLALKSVLSCREIRFPISRIVMQFWMEQRDSARCERTVFSFFNLRNVLKEKKRIREKEFRLSR